MHTGLRKIILINSYIKHGLVHEFDLSDNAHITGGNGAGKTSFLKLIPMFYGLETGKISPKTATSKNFSKWYLPTIASYIVFEFKTARGHLAQAVFCASPDGLSTRCRFINKGYEVSDYIFEKEGLSQAYSSEEIKNSWVSKGIDFTPFISSNRHYKQIIQNIPDAELGFDMYRYSLSSGRNHLKHIDKIIHSVVTGKMNIENIKSLLMEIMEESETEVNMSMSQNAVDSWISDYKIITSLNENKKEFSEAIENHDLLMGQEISLNTILVALHNKLPELQSDIENKVFSERVEQENLKVLKLERDEEKAVDTDNLIHIQSLIKDSEDSISAIEDKGFAYDDMNIDVIIAESSNRETYEHDLKRTEDEMFVIKSKVSEIDSKYASLISKSELNFYRLISEANKELVEEKSSKQTKISSAEKVYSDNLSEIKLEHSAKLSEINSSYESISYYRRLTEEKIKNPKVEGGYEEKIANREKKCLALLSDISIQEERTTIISLNKKLQEGERDKLLLIIADKNKNMSVVTKKIQEITDKLNPKSGNLISFLENNVTNWQSSNIGKIINPKLLAMNTLSPFYDKCNEETFYGLHLDLSELENNPNSTNEMLEEKSSLIEEEGKLILEIDEIEEEVKSITDKISLIEKSLTENKITIKKMKDSYVIEEESLNSLKIEFSTALANRIKVLNVRLKSLQKDINENRISLKSAIESHEEEVNELRDNYLLEKSDVESESDSKINILKNKYNELELSASNTKKDLTKRKNEAFKNSGLDIDVLEALENKMTVLNAKIQSIISNASKVTEYQFWMKNIYSQLTDKRNKQGELNKKEYQIKEIIRDNKNRFDREKEKSVNKLEIIGNELSKLETSLKSSLNILTNKTLDFQTVVDLESYNDESVNNLILKRNSLVSQISVKTESRDKSLRSIRKILENKSINVTYHEDDINIQKLWEETLRDEADSNSANAQMVVFKEIVNDIVPLIERNLISRMHIIGESLLTFRGKLKSFQSKINKSSKDISKAIGENINFEAISKIDIRMDSKINKVKGWRDIERGCESYEEIKAGSINAFPSKKFEKSLREISFHLEKGRIKEDLIDLFDIIFEVVENGNVKTARTAREFESLSSGGITTLLFCTLYSTLISLQRDGLDIHVLYPVDELGHLSSENSIRLLSMLNKNKITMIAALPNPNSEVMANFEHLYHIDENGLSNSVLPMSELESELIMLQKNIEITMKMEDE